MLLASVGVAFGCWVLWVLWKYRAVSTTGEKPLVKITLKDQAEEVEGLVRQLCRRHSDVRLMVVDAGSTDDTPEILKRLSTRYGFLFAVELKRYNAPGVE
jgi:hypothetical protein